MGNLPTCKLTRSEQQEVGEEAMKKSLFKASVEISKNL